MHIFMPNLTLCNMHKIRLKGDEINIKAVWGRLSLIPFSFSLAVEIELTSVFQIIVLNFLTRKDSIELDGSGVVIRTSKFGLMDIPRETIYTRKSKPDSDFYPVL